MNNCLSNYVELLPEKEKKTFAKIGEYMYADLNYYINTGEKETPKKEEENQTPPNL